MSGKLNAVDCCLALAHCIAQLKLIFKSQNMPQKELDSLGPVDRFRQIRAFSERIAAPLSAEDCAVQSMADASPTRWHLAHTTWFYETFLLKTDSGYRPFDARFEYLFNSYYNAVGEQFPRHRRGQISRPGLEETIAYRRHVDERVLALLGDCAIDPKMAAILEIGLNHEQQHQELMLTDLKHALAGNPLWPCYQEQTRQDATVTGELSWLETEAGLVEVGHSGQEFCFDNETPRHKTYLQTHAIASRHVTNAEYLEFMRDGGYRRPELWLSLGWTAVQQEGWNAPLYWNECESGWHVFTLYGLQPVDGNEPVCHVSFFEADAFARWAGCRLPTEFEWEAASNGARQGIAFADRLLGEGRPIHPVCEPDASPVMQGNVWDWTASQYLAYPGFQPAEGALGEYNGKFMCNQFVLRGGSCATSTDHIRTTYRNFFPPEARWQFAGIRLAK